MSIYVKDSILQKFPDIGDEFLPVLFAEGGIMPDRKGGGKTKSCYIVANLSGTYFLRPIKRSKLFKVSDFVSIYNVVSVIYSSEKRRTFDTRRREVFFECPHVDELVSIVLTMYKQILTGISDARQIRLVGFPFEPPIAPLPSIGNYSVIRYITCCLQTQDCPCKNIIELIEHANIIHNPRITLDQTHSPPNKLRSLCFPLAFLGKVKIVAMKNFADFVACRLAHFLLKHSDSIDTIIFQDYKCLIPEQLRFEKIIPRKLLSFAFINCQFNPSVLPSMFEEIGKYKGEIQRITFDKVSFSLDSWNSVFQSIRTLRPFKTLEVLEINNIDSPDINSDIATSTFINLFKYRRFILTFSCSFWTNPLSIGFDFYTNLSIIAEINFVSQDFSKPFPNSFRFPINIYSINLNKCLFSVESLKSLFNALLYHDKICISLHLSDIKLQKSELTSFYQSLQSIPPVTCIQELNWSGNRLDYSDIDKFVQYFFKSNKIRSFHIDRIFDYNQVSNLRHLFQLIGKNNIWKLSLGGDEQHNFKNNIKHVLDVLDFISPLNIIHFNDQFLTYNDLTDIFNYLKLQSFTEVSLDGSALINEENFFDFYDSILQLQIPIIARPNNDINRLFGEYLQKLKMAGRWNKFKTKFQEKFSPLPESGVSFYLNKTNCSFSDQKKYIFFLQRFPLVYFKLKDQDSYLLGEAQTIFPYPSLIALIIKKPARRLGDFQSYYLTEPTKIPRYQTIEPFSLPQIFNYHYDLVIPKSITEDIEFIPSLFTEEGIAIEDENISNGCHIVVNITGVCIYEYDKILGNFELTNFISVFNVFSFKYVNEKRRAILTRGREIFIECQHVDELLSIVNHSFESLYNGTNITRKIQLIDLPKELPICSFPQVEYISLIRYIASCYRFFESPNQFICNAIWKCDTVRNPRITLNFLCDPPNELYILRFPLIYFDKLQIVTLDGFSYIIACRIAHFLLKHSKTINTIIFENYFDLKPEQLRMEKIPPRKLLNFCFINCHFSDQVFSTIFEELGKYRGEIQRISLDNTTFSLKSWKSVFESIITQRPFNTLEILEINNIKEKEITNDVAKSTFINLFKHRRFIQKFSCNNWFNTLSIDSIFYNFQIISEIDFISNDFSVPFSNNFRFPYYLNSIRLKKCTFSSESLKSLFNTLSYLKYPFSLDLSYMNSRMNEFYQSLTSFTAVAFIKELNWSGNELKSNNIESFVKYFFDSNKIRSLYIDEIFGPQQINDVNHLFKLIGHDKLFKLSFCGNDKLNFSGNFSLLAEALDFISPLSILHFDNQKITDNDTVSIIKYLKFQAFTEVSFDASSISCENRFFDFYDDILELPIPVIGRPYKDIKRIYQNDPENTKMPDRWNKFKSKIQEKSAPLSESGFSFYLNIFIHNDDLWDQKKYIFFLQRFPLVYFELKDQDPYLLGEARTKIFYPSLITFRIKKPARRLGDFYSYFLVEPTKIPRYFPNTSFSLPHCFGPDYKPSQPIKFSININHQQINDDQQYDTQQFDQQQFEEQYTVFEDNELEKTENNDEVEKTENKNDDEINCFIYEDEKFHKTIDKIGESVSSVLYKIIDTRNQKLMCKKVLKCDPNLVTFKDLKNAMKEFDYLNSINHPSICHAIGINISEPNPDSKKEENEEEEDDDECTTVALFLEYIDYKLTDCLNQKILNNTLKTKIILEIIHGMAYIHQHGIIHRNLNIDNIMLNLNYDAKIINFAQAKLIECLIDQDSYSMSSMTKNIGSMLFMSPEMMNDDEEDYDNKTDVYSFGLILYYIFNGKLPKYTLNDKVKRKPIPIPNESPVMSNFCLNIITKCVSFDSKDRPSFVEILAELRSNSYLLAYGIDQSLIEKRDKELMKIDKL